MSRLFTGLLLMSAFTAVSAFAQPQYGAPPDPRYGGPPNGRYGQNNVYAPDGVSGLIRRVHADLNQAYNGGWRFDKRDRGRLDNAEKQLRDFARKWRRGNFDKGELDDAIESIQHVLNHNDMPPRDRANLDRDVNELRGMREAYNRGEIGRRR